MSSCRSRLYVRGIPLVMVRRSIKAPFSCPDLPLRISSTSGFFFWGMILDPVQKESGSLTQPNSEEKYMIRSSESLLTCPPKTAAK